MRIVLASPATPSVADVDIVTARGDAAAGLRAQRDVVVAGRVVKRARRAPSAVF